MSNVVPIDPSERDKARSRRPREVRAKVESIARMPKFWLELLREEAGPYPDGVERPRTRGDCSAVSRPCPFVSCVWNLYIDVNDRTGGLKRNFPDLEPGQMPKDGSCALDIADLGGSTLEAVGERLNLTRERVRQLEAKALKRFRAFAGPGLMRDLEEHLGDALNRPGSSLEDRTLRVPRR